MSRPTESETMKDIMSGISFEIRQQIAYEVSDKSEFRCYRCKLPYSFAHFHETEYSATRGCFPLCQSCWEELESPQNRLEFYESWSNEALRQSQFITANHTLEQAMQDADEIMDDWSLVEKAVKAGK